MKTLVRIFFGAALLAIAAPLLTRSAVNAPRYGAFGIDLTAMDKSVKPGDDFWAYMNGGWDARTPIAADRFNEGCDVKLTDQAEVDVRSILDDMARNPGASSAPKESRSAISTQVGWMRPVSRHGAVSRSSHGSIASEP